MRLKKERVLLTAAALMLGLIAFLLAGCEEDVAGTTDPKVNYKDQTFSLLVCDGNGNDENGWDHDGAAVCTLDWNADGSGPNLVPVNYVYNDYPLLDGVAENLSGKVAKGGDYWLWEKTPWTTINTGPIIGNGSGVKKVEVKALYTYVNPPRIWFFFRWEDPSHTIQPPKTSGSDPPPVGGTMHYYWYQDGGHEIPSDGFQDNRSWKSHEDWLALVWSTWFVWNTENSGKDWRNPDPEKRVPTYPADINGYKWQLVETVPGFQTKGIEACKGTSTEVYKTPFVNKYTEPLATPYGDQYYPGPYADMWFFSVSRNNYTSVGGWTDTESSYLFDCYIDKDGFDYPPVGSNENRDSLNEWLTFDSGIIGAETNGAWVMKPTYQAPNDPDFNPPGAYYIWSSRETAALFANDALWPPEGGARVSGYLNRPALGSTADVVCRCAWQQPGRMLYEPWEGKPLDPPDPQQQGDKLKKNYYGKDWHYTLEIMREIGTLAKIDPTEDVLLGLFDPHPGE